MKKKAFTLIELLAVIIILAIIALIAIPKILDIIDASKKSVNTSSVYMIMDAARDYYAEIMMNDNKKVEINGTTNIYDKIVVSGEKPQNGTLFVNENGQIAISVVYDNICYKKTFTDVQLIESDDVDNCTLTTSQVSYKCKRATKLHTETCSQTSNYCYASGYYSSGSKGTSTITYGSLGTSGTLKSGDAFDCDVNGDGVYDETIERFYYVSDLYNTTSKSFDSNYAVLIYYNNTYKGVADNTSAILISYDSSGYNYYGPRTGIAKLPSTTQWSGVSLSKTSRAILTQTGTGSTSGGTLPTAFSYSGYAARLLTVQEIDKACGITVGSGAIGELDSCNYLLENTKYSSSSMGTYGYWLENPYAFNDLRAWYVCDYNRRVYANPVSDTSNLGIRPAIEILKSDISY